MIRLFALALAFLSVSSALSASEWTPVIERLTKSAVSVNSAGGSCTGFVIHTQARKRGDRDKGERSTNFVLTAAHCYGTELYADYVPAKVVYKDAKKDLMVLEVDDLDRPALSLASANPKIGDEVASYGYGMALERPMFRMAHVSDTAMYIPESGIGGPFICIDAAFIGGQSGGPVVNAAGEIVLIVQRGGEGVGIGVGAEIIKAAVGRFFEGK